PGCGPTLATAGDAPSSPTHPLQAPRPTSHAPDSVVNGGGAPLGMEDGAPRTRRVRAEPACSSHVLVVLVVQDVEREQRHRLLAEVLPPVRGAERLPRHLAGLVQDRPGAVAGIFVDLAFDDVDQRGSVVVAVPGNDAAGLNDEPADPHLAVIGL